MISKTQIIATVLKRLKTLQVHHYLDLRTYKRNRSVIIVKKSEDNFFLIEDGYFQDEFTVEFGKVRKVLRGLLKKEFPRSTKIRLYTMGNYDPEQVQDSLRKVI